MRSLDFRLRQVEGLWRAGAPFHKAVSIVREAIELEAELDPGEPNIL